MKRRKRNTKNGDAKKKSAKQKKNSKNSANNNHSTQWRPCEWIILYGGEGSGETQLVFEDEESTVFVSHFMTYSQIDHYQRTSKENNDGYAIFVYWGSEFTIENPAHWDELKALYEEA